VIAAVPMNVLIELSNNGTDPTFSSNKASLKKRPKARIRRRSPEWFQPPPTSSRTLSATFST